MAVCAGSASRPTTGLRVRPAGQHVHNAARAAALDHALSWPQPNRFSSPAVGPAHQPVAAAGRSPRAAAERIDGTVLTGTCPSGQADPVLADRLETRPARLPVPQAAWLLVTMGCSLVSPAGCTARRAPSAISPATVRQPGTCWPGRCRHVAAAAAKAWGSWTGWGTARSPVSAVRPVPGARILVALVRSGTVRGSEVSHAPPAVTTMSVRNPAASPSRTPQ